MKRIIVSFCMCMILANANADSVIKVGSVENWGSFGEESSSAREMFIDSNNKRATFIAAQKIKSNGGYFIPVELFCSKHKKWVAWTQYTKPANSSTVPGQWLCADGFYGENCASYAPTSNPSVCTNTVNAIHHSKIKLSNNDSPDIEGELEVFESYDNWPKGGNAIAEAEVFLGIVRYLPNGVVAAPVKLVCGPNAGDPIIEVVSYLSGGKKRILCAQGYIPNTTNPDDPGADCVPYSYKCETQDLKFCSGYDIKDYNPDKHTLLFDDEKSCYKYACSDSQYAFKSATDKTCVLYEDGFDGGVNSDTGTYEKCSNGLFFDTNTNTCKELVMLSKFDLQYGLGQNQSGQVKEQCWQINSPVDYKACLHLK